MWVNISQAAKLTGYKYSEIRRLITKGAFPFYHNGKKAFKFELEDLKTAMKAEDENGDDYFFGYKSAINEEEPVPHLVVTGIFANTEDLKDGNGEMQVIELQVKE